MQEKREYIKDDLTSYDGYIKNDDAQICNGVLVKSG